MPHRFVGPLLAAFALALVVGFVACTGSSPTDQSINTDAGADYGLHPREVRPDTAATGAAGVGGAAGQGAGGAGGAAGADAGSPDAGDV